MPKSLADLRAAPPQARPERVVKISLAVDLIDEVQSLSGELARLPLTAVTEPDEPEDGPPRRQGQGEDPERRAARERATEIQARLAELLEEMADSEGEFGLRANLTDGEWRIWCNAHPPRPEGTPGHDRDQRVTYGLVDADALMDGLAPFAHTWNGEPLQDGDWARIFEPFLVTAYKAEMAEAVVAMYESRLDFQRLRSSLSGNLKRLNGSGSPAH